ncbi:MAG TPA: hypothetical protein VKY31_09375 [Terriglobia bacterium]|nr:hypothetical protein [Terriglobia bacterium]
MFRSFGVILLAVMVVAVMVPGSLQAQRRPAQFHGGVSPRPGTQSGLVGHGPVAPFVNPPVNNFGHAPSFHSGRSVVQRPIVRGPRTVVVAPAFGYGYGYPYYSPFFDPYNPYGYAAPVASEPVYSEPAYVDNPQPAVSQNEAELSYQVGKLSQEIEDLRQQQAQVAQLQRPPQPLPPDTFMPVVLIFKDGHRTEVQNYAIVGQTLWVLDEKNSSKIPLSDLDLEASQKENRSHGVRFSIPGR